MNELHLQLCASPEWARYVREELVPWALDGAQLGRDVLELGPGPGRTTDELRTVVHRLTVLEVDDQLAAALERRLAGTNVEVLCGDATASGLSAARFSAVTCFTMLHHVPSLELQNRLFCEARRVLRPGGVFVGTDVIDTPGMRDLHLDDTFVPVDPATLSARLVGAGLDSPEVDVVADRVRFRCFAPSS